MKQLEKTTTCIICLTPQNVSSTWIFFEAGAIAGKRTDAKEHSFLVGVKGEAIASTALSQYQSTIATKEDTWPLVRSINDDLTKRHDETVLRSHFESQWPALEQQLEQYLAELKPVAQTTTPPGAGNNPPLSSEAELILMKASENRSDNIIMMDVDSGGFILRANEEQLASPDDARQEANFRAAMDDMLGRGWVVPYGGSGSLFALTKEGYKAADRLRAKASGKNKD
jgi:hypothetical protein